jgi:hypothetical protein
MNLKSGFSILGIVITGTSVVFGRTLIEELEVSKNGKMEIIAVFRRKYAYLKSFLDISAPFKFFKLERFYHLAGVAFGIIFNMAFLTNVYRRNVLLNTNVISFAAGSAIIYSNASALPCNEYHKFIEALVLEFSYANYIRDKAKPNSQEKCSYDIKRLSRLVSPLNMTLELD